MQRQAGFLLRDSFYLAQVLHEFAEYLWRQRVDYLSDFLFEFHKYIRLGVFRPQGGSGLARREGF